MKEQEFLDGVSNIAPDIVERFVSMDNKLQKKASRPGFKGARLRLAAVAACLALIIGAAVAVPMLLRGDLPGIPSGGDLLDVPQWDTAQYSAQDIADLFAMKYYDGGATNAYTKIYVPDSKYLDIGSVPDRAYVDLYRYAKTEKELSEDEMRAFIDAFLPGLAESLGAPVPSYGIEERHYSTGNQLSASVEMGSYHLSVSQIPQRNSLGLSRLKGDRQIVIGGEAIEIDQRLSDEEIVDSLQSIKNKLFGIFGVSFPDAKVIRKYGSYSEYGAERIDVYFYDESAHALNATQSRPITDNIHISFDNFANYAGDIVSDSTLTVASVYYFKDRVDTPYNVMASTKRISLSEAEALLYRGYVFGGHSCPLCMRAQDKISFDGYDFVDMEYMFGIDQTGTATVGIPFYTFYKNIGISKNGNTIYAKTYVPAIEVRGYEAYFESQKDDHGSGLDADAFE